MIQIVVLKQLKMSLHKVNELNTKEYLTLFRPSNEKRMYSPVPKNLRTKNE
jgi:hypothetical protein